MLPLFDNPEESFKHRLAEKLKPLTAAGIYLGGSSWKYEGWLDQIYTRDRYMTRGRFSQKRFEQECLAEYAEVFPAVGGDFSFYQFPTETFWRKLFQSAPPHLRFGLKVPEEITVRTWPGHPRYGPRAGTHNENFLSFEMLKGAFLMPLLEFKDRIGVLMFEFGAAGPRSYAEPPGFLDDLAPLLDQLPDDFRYAVEIRSPELLTGRYLDLLRARNIAHVFNAWTRMPILSEQLETPGVFTADFSVCRALLRHGRNYEQAVQMFTPYTQVQDPDPEVRSSLRKLIRHSREHHRTAYIFVNNRLEGNAPQTIEAIVAE